MKKLSKKMKTLAIAGGVLASVAAPIAAIVSCGPETSSKTITVGFRAEEASFYKDAIDQFQKATGHTVKIKLISDQINNYTAWGTTSIPDVTLGDATTMKVGKEKGWFKPLNLKDMMENKDYMIEDSKLSPEYQEKQLSFDSNTFNMEMLNSVKEKDDQYYGMPLIYGPKLLYAWKNAGDTHLIDDNDSDTSTKLLKWFVPKKDGGLEEVHFTGTTHATNPLLDKNNHPYSTSYADIQQFISDAADSTELGINFGGASPQEALLSTEATKRVIATGAYGQRQRIVSIGKSIASLNPIMANAYAGTSDAAFNFAALIQGEKGYKANGVSFQDIKSGALDDSKWLTSYKETWAPNTNKINGTKVATQATTSGDAMAASFLGNIGYFAAADHGLVTTTQAKQSDQLSVFAKKSSIFLEGATWQKGGILTNAVASGAKEEDITAFSLPFFESGIDGYALNNKLTGEKELVAKKFMRFLMQAKVSSQAASDKTLAIRHAGKDLQLQNSANTPFTRAVTSGGRPSSSIIQNPIDSTFVVSKLSTQNLFDLYNEKMLKNSWDGVLQGNAKAITFEEYSRHLAEISDDIGTTASLS